MPREYASEENARVADLLDEIGDLIELKGENVFRAVTYRAAAREIRDLREPIRSIYEAGHLASIPKVGASVGEAIAQYLQGGKARRHEELKAAVPDGLLTLHKAVSSPLVGSKACASYFTSASSRSIFTARVSGT